jgi:putative ABC transport system permease protein
VTLTGLAARNLLRNKVRSVLTILGVAVAILTFMFLRTISYAWTAGAEYAAKDRLVTRHKITFVMSLPKRYIDDVRNMPGVKSATYANWFGGKDPAHDTEFFGSLAVDTATYFDVLNEMAVPPENLATWKADRSGAIVGDVLAKKLNWKVGDKVTLESGIYPTTDASKPWTFTIDGIYSATAKSVDRSSFLFHWDYLNEGIPEGRRNEIGWINSRVTDPSHAADTSLALDRMFETREIQTLSQDERAFATSFLAGISAILKAVDVISVVILVIMMLILGNTIAMGVRERTNEYGVLRAIGFLPSHITGFIVGEATLIGAVGGLVGLGVSYPIIEQGMGRWLEENMGSFFPYFRIATSDSVIAMCLAFGLGIVAAILPAFGASKLRVTDALRRIA